MQEANKKHEDSIKFYKALDDKNEKFIFEYINK